MYRDLSKSIESDQRRVRVLSFIVNQGTSVSGTSSTAATVVDNGTGDYSVTFVEPFRRVPEVHLMAASNDVVLKVANVTASGFDIAAINISDGLAADSVVYCMVVGSDDPDFI